MLELTAEKLNLRIRNFARSAVGCWYIHRSPKSSSKQMCIRDRINRFRISCRPHFVQFILIGSVVEVIAVSYTHLKLIEHINRTYQRKYTINNFTFTIRHTRIFSEYGVFVIDKDKVKKLLEDVQLFEGMTVEYDVKLITFLHDFCVQNPKLSLIHIYAGTDPRLHQGIRHFSFQ